MRAIPASLILEGDATVHGIVVDALVSDETDKVTLVTDKYPAGYIVSESSMVRVYTDAD